ncbi:AsmA family protein [Rouxiella sp. Mn2063]|uniref:AsmA family protein n=1 Tax=Rouxiella sp. Mn2063 TaxID=3395262 RepID=UPI003BDF83D9
MKIIGKTLTTLVLLVVLAIVLLYVALQTRWAASWISNWVNENSQYRLSVNAINYNWSTPNQIGLVGVKLAQKNQPDLLNADEVDFHLGWRQLTDPTYFDRIVLMQGNLNLQSVSQALPVQADTLQLYKMTLKGNADGWNIAGDNINAGITPWLPTKTQVLGDNAQLQLSADNLTIDDIAASNVLIQGKVNKQQLTLTNFGADLARGELTGQASRAADGSWTLDNVRLSNIRMQSAQTLEGFLDSFKQIPKIDIKSLELADARLQGQNWAFSDVNLSVKDITYSQGDWQSNGGNITFNATDMIANNLHFINPAANLDFSPQGIAIKQISTRWEGSQVSTSGNWQRDSQRLQLDQLSIAALEYTLPENWRDLWLQTLPSWLSEVSVTKFTGTHNLVIDISPDFPFQLTALDGSGENLLLARNHQWGIWSGKLNLTASDATFNKNDLRRLSLVLDANSDSVNISQLNAYTKEGLLEATATISQQPRRDFSVKLTGKAVPANELQNWGWPPLPLEGNANLQVDLKGQMPANVDFKPTLNGNLHAIVNGGKQVQQEMVRGAVK